MLNSRQVLDTKEKIMSNNNKKIFFKKRFYMEPFKFFRYTVSLRVIKSLRVLVLEKKKKVLGTLYDRKTLL